MDIEWPRRRLPWQEDPADIRFVASGPYEPDIKGLEAMLAMVTVNFQQVSAQRDTAVALLAALLQTMNERAGECAGKSDCRDGVHDWACVVELIETYRPKLRAFLAAAGVEVE